MGASACVAALNDAAGADEGMESKGEAEAGVVGTAVKGEEGGDGWSCVHVCDWVYVREQV